MRNGTRSTPASTEEVTAGKAYNHVDFSLCLFTAQTSLKAKLAWLDNVRSALPSGLGMEG